MTINPVVLIVWAALAVCFMALLVYRGQLTRYEEDQLFLNDEVNRQEQDEQTAIVKKVRQIEPVVRVIGGAAGLMTAGIVGLYVFKAWQTLQ